MWFAFTTAGNQTSTALGDDAFIKQHQATLKEGDFRELFIAHKRILALSLMEYAEQADNRNAAMVAAYQSGTYTMAEIARYFDVHYMTVSRAERCGRWKGDYDGCISVGTDPICVFARSDNKQKFIAPLFEYFKTK